MGGECLRKVKLPFVKAGIQKDSINQPPPNLHSRMKETLSFCKGPASKAASYDKKGAAQDFVPDRCILQKKQCYLKYLLKHREKSKNKAKTKIVETFHPCPVTADTIFQLSSNGLPFQNWGGMNESVTQELGGKVVPLKVRNDTPEG